MERIEQQNRGALAWLRYVLNQQSEMPLVTDWAALLSFAIKQALIGISFPENSADKIQKDIRIQWVGMVLQVEQQNRLLNRRVEELFDLLEKDGFRCCLLKGQGNAEMYPNPLLRCTGDIDLWIDTDEITAYEYVKKQFPEAEVSFKHVHFPVFKDVSVDVHFTPLKFYSVYWGKRLQRWIEKNKEEQFVHCIRLTGGERAVCVPTDRFNVVYQLGHMLIHLYDKGLGFRQVVDYFYLLKDLEATDDERGVMMATIRDMGMGRFCRAMMWIDFVVLGLPEERCLVDPCARLGRRLLRDILDGGNFGHYNHRNARKRSFFIQGLASAFRNIRLLPFAPREGMAALFRRMGTAISYAENR